MTIVIPDIPNEVGGGGGTQYTDGATTPIHPIGNELVFDNGGTLTAVSAANPLPTSATVSTAGLATSANQATSNTNTGNTVTQATNLNTVEGLTSDAAVTGDNTGTHSAKLRGLNKMIADMWDSTNHWLQVKVMNAVALGQSTMANSSPVTIASNQSPIPVKPGFTELSGLSAAALNADFVVATDISDFEWLVLQISPNAYVGTLSFAFSNDNVNWINCFGWNLINDNGNSAAASTTAVNQLWGFFKKGRYFRVRMTAYTSGTAQGALEMYTAPPAYASSGVIVGASGSSIGTVQPGNTPNTTPWLVNQATAATGTKSNVASSASSVTILASNASRKGAMIYNDSTQILYLDLSGGTASNSSYSVQVGSQAFFEVPGPSVYNGLITGIWASANGNARVTEFS